MQEHLFFKKMRNKSSRDVTEASGNRRQSIFSVGKVFLYSC